MDGRGDLPDRDVDDIGDQALTYAEIKALSTGDPRIMEKAGVDADVARLTRLQRAHHDDQHRLRRTLDSAEQRARRYSALADDLDTVLAAVTDTRGDRFHMTIDGTRYAKRVDAGSHPRTLLLNQINQTAPDTMSEPLWLGQLAGLDIHARIDTRIAHTITLHILAANIELDYHAGTWRDTEPARLVQRLEHRIQHVPTDLAAARHEAAAARIEAERARSRLGQPFEYADQLARLQRRQLKLNDALAPDAPGPAEVTDAPIDGSPAGAVRRRLDRLSTPFEAAVDDLSPLAPGLARR